MMKIGFVLKVFLFFVIVVAAFIPTVNAITLFDGKVIIHGKISEQWLMRVRETAYWEKHDYKLFNARTTLKLETMWRAYRGSAYEINVYGVWKNFYDKAHEIDDSYRRYLHDFGGHHAVEEVKSYETFRDICRELYTEINHDLFQVRLGKQIVSWGETSFERMTDIINPVDLRGNLNPAYPDFAEIKRGLWMLRLFLTPYNMPGELSFELVVIPDFQPNRLWPAGYHLTHPEAFNQFRHPNDQFLSYYRDAPSNWKTPEWGIRIRGFTWGFDWTLLYFHHRTDDPVIRKGDAILSVLPALTGRGRAKHVNHYGWQNTYGFTFNKTIDYKITVIPGTTFAMSGNILRGEFVWEANKDFNEQIGQNVRVGEFDRYAFVLGWDTKIFIPGLTPWARNKHLASSTQIFMEWAPERHRQDLIYPWVVFRKQGHHFSTITQSFNYELWNGRILPGFYAAYYLTEGGGYYAPALGFKPTFKWTFLVRYLDFFDLGHGTNKKNDLDTLTFEVTYEF